MTDGTFDPSGPARPGSGIFGLDHDPLAAVRLIPVPFDATTSYRHGTSAGPAAILEASHQVDLLDHEWGKPYESGILMTMESEEIHDLNAAAAAAARGPDRDSARSRALVDRAGARVNQIVHAKARAIVDAGAIPGVVGGDHASPYGLIAALSERHAELGILHVDAHMDLREAYEGYSWSHASIMHNVVTRLPQVTRIVQVGIRDFCEEERAFAEESDGRIRVHHDADLARARFRGVRFDHLAATLVADLPGKVYVSLDVDGLDPANCPNTGTPVPGGLSFQETCHLLFHVVQSGRTIVGFDLCEVAPGSDEWDAIVGARLLYKLIGAALASRG